MLLLRMYSFWTSRWDLPELVPGLVTMVAEDQLQRVHQIGFSLFKGFALREDIRQFLKGDVQ